MKKSSQGSPASCGFPPFLLQLWSNGTLAGRAFIAHLLVHLSSSCSSCERALLTPIRQHPSKEPGEGAARAENRAPTTENVVERAVAQVRALKEKIHQSARSESGRDLFEAYQSVSASQRQLWIEGLPAGRSALRLGRRLLLLSRETASSNPRESVILARLGAGCGSKIFPLRLYRLLAKDLRALAAALEGNGHRLLGDYGRAVSCFQDAESLLVGGSGDPVTCAEIYSYHASLLRDQSNLSEAASRARRSAAIFRKVGEHHAAGCAYLQLSAIQYDMARAGRAVRSAELALILLDCERHSEVVQSAYENLALYVSEAGNPLRAREILAEHPSPSGRSERLLLHRRWQEHLITAKLGDQAEAIQGLREVRDAFAALGDAPNAATITLDLALIHGEAGEALEMGRAAAEALPLLLPLGLPKEVLGTLMMLEKAAQAEAVSLGLVREAQRKLSRAASWRDA